jgi:hypothetical protein
MYRDFPLTHVSGHDTAGLGDHNVMIQRILAHMPNQRRHRSWTAVA